MADAETPSVILTGFMGTGKTLVGRRLARDLERPFADMDDLIVERAGKPIPSIFAQEGEKAFRNLETEVCREVSRRRGWVIATGGGTVVSPENRETLQSSGLLICLTAAPDRILERVGQDANRPMLGADMQNRLARIEELLRQRAPHYNAVSYQVDTTHLTAEEVSARIEKIARDHV